MEWAVDGGGPEAVSALRREVMVAYLRRHANPESDLAGAEVVVAELLSNAFEHAPGPAWVRIDWAGERQEKFDESFPRPRNLFSFVEVQGGGTPENTAALQSALDGFPDLALDTEAGWVDVRASGLDQVLNLFYVLLALSVIVSLFGMVNTLILSVFERTRELGMLRAVGMTRRQVRRMVRQESVITALIGAAVGLPLGLFLAALISNALADEGIGFQVPWVQLVAFTIVALIAGVLAAIVPARRAARLNVLRALQYE